MISGVSISLLSPSPIEGGRQVSSPSDIHVDSYHVTYNGTEIKGVEAVVNNTRSLSATVTVSAKLTDSSGTTIASGSTTVTADAGTQTVVTVTFDTGYAPQQYSITIIRVTE